MYSVSEAVFRVFSVEFRVFSVFRGYSKQNHTPKPPEKSPQTTTHPAALPKNTILPGTSPYPLPPEKHTKNLQKSLFIVSEPPYNRRSSARKKASGRRTSASHTTPPQKKTVPWTPIPPSSSSTQPPRPPAFAALILAPPLYAWADRWLDRTHHSTAHEHRD